MTPADSPTAPAASTDGVLACRWGGTDLDEAEALFRAAYRADDYDVRPGERSFAWGHTVLGDRSMSLRTTTFLATMRGTAHPHGEYVVGWTRSGGGVIGPPSGGRQVGPQQPWAFPSDGPFAFELGDVEMSAVQLDRDLVDALAVEQGVLAPLHLDHALVPDAAALRQWRDVVARVARTWHDPATLARPLLRRELARTAGLALLAAFVGDDATTTGAGVENRAVRVAVEHLRANAHLPVGTAEAAAAAGLSVRGLQQAFRRTLDTTPSAYLRGVRLERVHAELVAAEPGDGTLVSDVARRWGFVHLGRFAGTYQERYGEAPARTLRRSGTTGGPPKG